MEPAITAPHDTWFNITVRTSAVADVELTCGGSRSGTRVVGVGEEVVGDMILSLWIPVRRRQTAKRVYDDGVNLTVRRTWTASENGCFRLRDGDEDSVGEVRDDISSRFDVPPVLGY